MGVTECELEILTLQRDFVTNASDNDLLGLTLGYASDHI